MASKSYRKFMATGLTAAVVASAVAPVASAATFTDVPAGAWYKGAVDYVSGKGYMTGTSSTTFAPTKDITRAEAATLFANKLDLYKAGQIAGYSDVKSGAWYHNAVAAVKEGKIMGSTGGDMFSPDRLLTRGEVAALIVRAYGLEGTGKSTSFTDVSNSIFKNDIATLVELGIADGVTGTTFAPNKAVSRAEMAAFIQKADEAQNATPAVKSVSAINAKTLEVKFNKAMEEGTGVNGAENTANYAVASNTVTSATLSEDGKTVVLGLGTALTNQSATAVTVLKNVKTADGVALGDTNHVSPLYFNDNVKPTVSSITSQQNGDITIKFSEVIVAGSATVWVNGQSVVDTQATDSDSVTVTKAALVAAGVTAGNSYEIIVTDANDVVGVTPNEMSIYNGTFTYNPVADTNGPSVKSVTVKDEDTLTIELSEAVALTTTQVQVFKGTTPVVVAVNAVPNTNKYEVELPSSVYGAGETSVALKLAVKAYKDASNNFGTNLEQNVTINKDTQGPTVSSVSYDATGNEFEISFNEDLATGTPAAGDFILTDANGVLYTAVPKANDGKKIVLDASGLANGTYSVQVKAGTVTDASIDTNDNVAANLTLVKSTTATTETVKPTVTFAEVGNVITATFSEPVKAGNVTGSATLLSNYKLGGQALPAGTVITSNSQSEVVITLPADSIATSKAYILSVSGVQDLAGNVIETYSEVEDLTDNTKPVLSSAAYQSNGTIKLTFSESVIINATPTANTNDEDDFVVTINGNALTSNDFTVAAGSTGKELVLTAGSGITFASGTISVKTADTTSIADVVPNLLKAAITVNVSR
jgi:S-layer homology domain/Bacterial Ig-like domain